MSKARTERKTVKAVENAPQWKAFRCTPDGPVPIKPPTPEQQRSLSEQQAAMFTPDGQFRLVMEIREKASKGLLKPRS